MVTKPFNKETLQINNVFKLKPLAFCVRAVLTSGLFMGASSPAQAELPVAASQWTTNNVTSEVIGNTMNINQFEPKVELNWKSFNVGRENTVNFKQPDASSVAVNRIRPDDAAPSQILGRVTANGQIYLINQNGFVFGKDSVVDTRGLVASTLEVSKEVIEDGISKVAALDGRAAFEGKGEFYLKDKDGSFVLDQQGQKVPIKIEVQEGANISANDGKSIMILAPTIINKGNISADGGQVLMAAATDKVYLQEAPTDENDPNSDVRGLMVEVKTGGKVENLGSISANRGNVTLMGFAVNQEGRVSATTSINENGTIRLLAREGGRTIKDGSGNYNIQPGSTTRTTDNGDGLGTSARVKLGGQSTTNIAAEIQYDDSGAETSAINGQSQPQSRVEIMAHKVTMQSGAQVVAPSGKVEVTATESPASPVSKGTAKNGSSIEIESGATIDVSGLDATKTMESNVIAVKLQSNQFKDAPLQKDGALFGKTVYVDIREGTTLADISAELAAVKHTLAERLTTGGVIALNSEGKVEIQNNAVLDFSGGTVTYLDGYLKTTKLVADGVVYDIGKADPLMRYGYIFGEYSIKDAKWGETQTWLIDAPFALGQFEKGYTEGHDAGSLKIAGNNVVLNGDLLGDVVIGRTQRELSKRPKGGSIEVDITLSPDTVQNIEFAERNLSSALALVINPNLLVKSGIENAVFKTNGAISVADNTSIGLMQNGSLTMQGGAIDVAGKIKGAGASVQLSTALTSGTLDVLDGHINVTAGADIDLQGRWVNDITNPDNINIGTLLSINGGKFKAVAQGDVNVLQGSSIDVSGGAWLQADKNIKAGQAGEIDLVAKSERDYGSNLTLTGSLKGYGLENGGKLSLEANAVRIGGSIQNQSQDATLRPLQLDDDFFSKGGFADYVVTSDTNGLTVAEDTVINLVQTNRVLDNGYLDFGNADNISSISTIGTLLPEQRASSSLTLNANHSLISNPVSDLVVEKGARINADDLSTVSLVSDSSIDFNGAITAHGGKVSLEITAPQDPTDPLYRTNQGIWLGKNADIDVSGISRAYLDRHGNLIGDVYDGGSVSIAANRGFVAALEGSSINVSGAQALLDLHELSLIALGDQEQNIGSNGGKVNVLAAEGIFWEGGMRANAGNAQGVTGGSLSVQLDMTHRNVPEDIPSGSPGEFPEGARTLFVTQRRYSIFDAAFSQAGDKLSMGNDGQAFISADQIADAGFSSVTLHSDDEIRFQGDVSLAVANSLQLDAPVYGWETAKGSLSGQVDLTATTVTMGSAFTREAVALPGEGAGQFNVHANLIDLQGASITDGFASVNLSANKDIRLQGVRILQTDRSFLGEFKTYSNLTLTAERIFPTTLSQFSLAAAGDSSGKIAINSNGNADSAPVLSAYASLTLEAPYIEQNGVIKVPFGTIALKAEHDVKFGANSLTSVSGEGQVIPFGITSAGLDWLYPIGDQNLIISAPNKRISISADRVLKDEGAVIDLSGGGDVMAYEFVPGLGGSADVLDTDQAFAVLPGYTGYAPVDPLETRVSGLKTGDNLYLGSGSKLAAGMYTLLPARYALLPGAFLITPQTSHNHAVEGWVSTRIDGAPIVSGYRAVEGTTIRDQQYSTYAVETGEVALTRSELVLHYGNDFFANQALKNDLKVPRLPQDAGRLSVEVGSYLELPALATAGILGAQVDISSNNIRVVNQKTGATGAVELLASDINEFNVESLLLGGIRSEDSSTGTTVINAKASTVTVAENTALQAPELMLTAKDRIDLKQGARLQATDRLDEREASELHVSGDSALVRVAAGQQATLKRSESKRLTGDLVIDQGAILAANGGSVLLDATHNSQLNGNFELNQGSLSIGAENINLGETNAGLSGLSMNNALLDSLDLSELKLTSRGSINLYGNVETADLGDLVLNSAGLAGFDNLGKTANIRAKTLTLTNAADVSGANGTGGGSVSIAAGKLILAEGNYSITGFKNVNFDIAGQLIGADQGQLKVAGDTLFKTAAISGETAAETIIDASGFGLNIIGSDAAKGDLTGVGAQLTLKAASVNIDSVLNYAGGNVTAIAATGNLTLGKNALIDVSGAQVYAGLSAPAKIAGGEINLTSQQQNVIAEAGSRMLLSGVTAGVSAGALNVNAGNGLAGLYGAIDARGSNDKTGGQLKLDVATLDASGFQGLNAIAAGSGFSGLFDLRLRQSDLSITGDHAVTAQTINIATDNGQLTVDGVLDASGSDGGSITLSAEDRLILGAGARLLANAEAGNGNGGRVRLASMDSQNDDAGITVNNGARIDVSNRGGALGEVRLRADRKDTNADGITDVNVTSIPSGTIIGDVAPEVEAVKIYNKTTLATGDINTIKTDTTNYMNALINNNVVHDQFGDSFKILPGIEVRSNANLTLNGAWDLVSWRYGNDKVPGILTLRAANNLLINNNLSDAFATGILKQNDFNGFGDVTITDMLQTGKSWSYNLVAGADMTAADQHAIVAGKGDLSLSADKKIRTGTGDIDIRVGQDMKYGSDKSVIYTAGRPDDTNRYGFKRAIVGYQFYAEYPIDGGDITVVAGRDIIGKPTTQLVTDWLVRTGNWSTSDDHKEERPTAWGIAVGGVNKAGDYRESIGVLGGGNVKIKVGGNINDLSVVIPTTGKQIGEPLMAEDFTNPESEDAANWGYKTNIVQVNGGGNLDLDAGGNIAGGVFYVDNGIANIFTDGALNAGTNKGKINPILALGDAQMNVTAGKGITLDAIVDPMVLPQGKKPDTTSLFFRYNADSAVSLTALSGDVTLNNDSTAIKKATDLPLKSSEDSAALLIYPSALKVAALGDNINILKSFSLYPGATGTLELFANNDITTGFSGNAVKVILTDTDPAYLPSIGLPASGSNPFKDASIRLTNLSLVDTAHAATPVHKDDKKPVLLSTAAKGSIKSNDSLLFGLAKSAWIKAGEDVEGVSFQIQHNNNDSSSLITAGRDIKYNVARNEKTGTLLNLTQKIEVSGPGQLAVVAGRNVDMGSSDGITSIGNTFNTNLPENGADLIVLAGLADGRINVDGFANKFLTDPTESAAYTNKLTAYMRGYSGNQSLDTEQAAGLFASLSDDQRRIYEAGLLPSVQGRYFSLLSSIVKERAQSTLAVDKDRLELQILETIETLFPGTTSLSANADAARVSKGDISLFFSRIHTFDHGDISLMTPNGGINAGLAVTSEGQKDASGVGIVVQDKGNINAVVRDDFAVNLTRVMTLNGGDVFAGSTEGDVDAGKGAQTSLAAPRPKVQYDKNGNPVVTYPPILNASGIRSVSPPGVEPGDVLLFALRGVIDAGEAGIAGNNITLDASSIRNAQNIDVSGSGVGVPVAATGSIAAGLAGTSGLAASATKSIENTTDVAGTDANQTKVASALGVLNVEILGFGE